MDRFKIRQDSSGKIQPTEGRYLWEPSVCCMCSRPPEKQDETFANLQVELDYFGNLYLCLNCCAEVADFIGFVAPNIYAERVKNLVDTKKALTERTAQLQEAKALLDVRINSAGDSVPSSDGDYGIPLFEVDEQPDIVDSVINSDKPVAVKSGKK